MTVEGLLLVMIVYMFGVTGAFVFARIITDDRGYAPWQSEYEGSCKR